MPVDFNIIGGITLDQASLSATERRLQSLGRNAVINLKVNSLPLGKISSDVHAFDLSLQAATSRVAAFTASTSLLYGIAKAFTSITKSFIDTEASIASIQSVLNTTTSGLEKFKSALFEAAKNGGKTFEETAQGAISLSRQGLKATETINRLNAAIILSRQSGDDLESSIGGVTSAINSFNKQTFTAIELVNKLSSVDQNFAVGSKDLIESIKRTGSSAQEAGVDLDKLIAITTSLSQTTARGGAIIGNALKSIFTRLGRENTLSALEQFNVATRDLQGNVLSADKVLQNLANTYKDLSTTERAAITERVSGIQQINQLKALLGDLARANSVYGQSLAVSGEETNSAIERNKLLNQTLLAQINALKVNATQFSSVAGNLVAKPVVNNLVGKIANPLLTLFSNQDEQSKSSGQKLGEGLLKGLGQALSGPGLILGASLLTNVFLKLGKNLINIAGDYATFNTKTKEQANIQVAINQVLQSGNEQYIRRLNAARNIKEQEEAIRSIMLEQAAIQIRNQSLVFGGAQSYVRAGGRVSSNNEFKIPRAAAGIVPIAQEQDDINRGVGGASKSAQPKLIQGFNFGGGKKGPVVANTDEYIVKNYAGGSGDAIFNQNMVSSYGLPSGASKINAAGGLVPNYAGFIGPTKRLLRNFKDLGVNFNRWGDSPQFKPMLGLGSPLPPEIQIPSSRNGGDPSEHPVFALFHEAGHLTNYMSGIERSPKYKLDFKSAATNERFANSRALELMERAGVSPEIIEQFKPFARKNYDSYRRNLSGKGFRKDIPKSAFSLGDLENLSSGLIPNYAKYLYDPSGKVDSQRRLAARSQGYELVTKEDADFIYRSRASIGQKIDLIDPTSLASQELKGANKVFNILGAKSLPFDKYQEARALKLGDARPLDLFLQSRGAKNTGYGINGAGRANYAKDFYVKNRVGAGFSGSQSVLTDVIRNGSLQRVASAGVSDPSNYFLQKAISNPGKLEYRVNLAGVGKNIESLSGATVKNNPTDPLSQPLDLLKAIKTGNIDEYLKRGIAESQAKKAFGRLPVRSRSGAIGGFDVLQTGNSGIDLISQFESEVLGEKVYHSKGGGVIEANFSQNYSGRGQPGYSGSLDRLDVLLSASKALQKNKKLGYASGLIPNYTDIHDLGNGGVGAFVNNVGKKGNNISITIGSGDGQTGLISFRSKDGYDEKTGVGAFKTMNEISPTFKELIREAKKNGINRFTFSTDTQRQKLFSRYLKKFGATINNRDNNVFSFPENLASGLVPNYNDQIHSLLQSGSLSTGSTAKLLAGLLGGPASPLTDAINREKSAGIPLSQIRVEKSSSLTSAQNPGGLAITNTRDEPGGINQGIARAKQEGRNPKTYGSLNSADGLIPNYALNPSNPSFEQLRAQKQQEAEQEKQLQEKIEREEDARQEKIRIKNVQRRYRQEQEQARIRRQRQLSFQERSYESVIRNLTEGVVGKNNISSNFIGRGAVGSIIDQSLNSPAFNTLNDVRKDKARLEARNIEDSLKQQRNQSLNSRALTASFAVPIVAGGVTSLFNQNDPSTRKANAIAGGIGTGLSSAAVLAGTGPYGIAVGLAIGALTGFKGVVESSRKSLEDYSKELQDAKGIFENQKNSVAGVFGAQDNLKEILARGGSNKEINNASQAIQSFISEIDDPRLRNKVLAARTTGDQGDVLQELNARAIKEISAKSLAPALESIIAPNRGFLGDFSTKLFGRQIGGDTQNILTTKDQQTDLTNLIKNSLPKDLNKDQISELKGLKGPFNLDSITKITGGEIDQDALNKFKQLSLIVQEDIAKNIVQKQLSADAIVKETQNLKSYNSSLLNIGRTLERLQTVTNFKFGLNSIAGEGIRGRAISGASQGLNSLGDFLSPETRNRTENKIKLTELDNEKIGNLEKISADFVGQLKDLPDVLQKSFKLFEADSENKGGDLSGRSNKFQGSLRKVALEALSGATNPIDTVNKVNEGFAKLERELGGPGNDQNKELIKGLEDVKNAFAIEVVLEQKRDEQKRALQENTNRLNELNISLNKKTNFLGGGSFEQLKDFDISKIEASSATGRTLRDNRTNPFRNRIFESRGNSFDDFFRGKKIDNEAETGRRADVFGSLAGGKLQLAQLGLLENNPAAQGDARNAVQKAEESAINVVLDRLEKTFQRTGDIGSLDQLRGNRGGVGEIARLKALKAIPLSDTERKPIEEKLGTINSLLKTPGLPESYKNQLKSSRGDLENQLGPEGVFKELNSSIIDLDSNLKGGIKGDFNRLTSSADKAAEALNNLADGLIKRADAQSELAGKQAGLIGQKNELTLLKSGVGEFRENAKTRNKEFFGLANQSFPAKGLFGNRLDPNKVGSDLGIDPDIVRRFSGATERYNTDAKIQGSDYSRELESYNIPKETLEKLLKLQVEGGGKFTPGGLPKKSVGYTDKTVSQIQNYFDFYSKKESGLGGFKTVEDEYQKRIDELDRLLQALNPEKNRSGGYLPNYSGGLTKSLLKEQNDINRGVGGARPGDSPYPTYIKGIGPAVVNTGEKIVRNYSGGKDAVFNREMMNLAGGSLTDEQYKSLLRSKMLQDREGLDTSLESQFLNDPKRNAKFYKGIIREFSDNPYTDIGPRLGYKLPSDYSRSAPERGRYYDSGPYLLSKAKPFIKQRARDSIDSNYNPRIPSLSGLPSLNSVNTIFSNARVSDQKSGFVGSYQDYAKSQTGRPDYISQGRGIAEQNKDGSISSIGVGDSNLPPAADGYGHITRNGRLIKAITPNSFEPREISSIPRSGLGGEYNRTKDPFRKGEILNRIGEFNNISTRKNSFNGSENIFGSKSYQKSQDAFDLNFGNVANNPNNNVSDITRTIERGGSPFQRQSIRDSGGLSGASLSGPRRFGGRDELPEETERKARTNRGRESRQYNQNTGNRAAPNNDKIDQLIKAVQDFVKAQTKPEGEKGKNAEAGKITVEYSPIKVEINGQVNSNNEQIKKIADEEIAAAGQRIEARVAALETAAKSGKPLQAVPPIVSQGAPAAV